jgi:hypothetical protein
VSYTAAIVFCRSKKPMMTRREIAEFINESGYFEEPRFRPSPSSRPAAQRKWNCLDVYYEKGKQHLELYLDVDNGMVEGQVEETIEEYLAPRKRSAIVKDLRGRLRATYQTVTVRVGFGGDEPTEDAWEMLTTLEDHIAQTYEGITYAPSGFYAPDGRPIYKLK